MKRLLAALLLGCALCLSACGSSHHATAAQKQEAKTEAAKFEAQAKKCLPTNGGVVSISPLKSHSGRQAFANCMVPQNQQRTFKLCLQKAIFSGGFNKIKIEASANACLKKVS